MKNLYNAMVLFLIVITITALFSCTHSSNDQEIFVADDNPSTQQMEIIKLVQAENRQVQIAQFNLEDGKILKLLRAGTNMSDIEIDQPCGLLDWCRNDLYCDGLFDGRCKAVDYIPPTDDQEIISIFVDDNLSTQQIMEIIEAPDNGSVQTGLFKLEDGKSLKLLRPATNGAENCIEVGKPCGLLHWCCGDLNCDGYFDGTCRDPNYCATSGGTCDGIHGVKCCKNLLCDFPISGTCRPLDYCLPLGFSCGTSIFPCCPGSFCVLVPVILKAMCIL